MKLTVIYDNETKNGLESGWGFACFIETEDHNILFDTGWDGHVLLKNMDKLSIDPENIDILVLSHQHWDHIGGVTTFLNRNPDVDIYVPSSFSSNLKREIASKGKGKLYGIKTPQEICNNIYTTGELGSEIKEQSLILKSEKGLYVLTGCAHPGLSSIIEVASSFGDVTGIFGGLHDSQEYGLFKDMQLIGAGHCTSHKDAIRKMYPKKFLKIYAGYSVEL
ncbi:MBL fold metallo-hydrolase [Methanolobus sp.]|jgi:7,8-dihydropterin-6-yl-methyl-4-(beta-D-ribofuranosyl)aminobenzene 5'-phosphate synthase|uniref:MBL fold metallo-hydrolase n=1 Tax=Methanolobus sp. TaxID=1874737 RepID=UPI00260063E7|nr:MBL fold metallo-hydrolase [Methanolobus sp.]